jgi:hypothetical protein
MAAEDTAPKGRVRTDIRASLSLDPELHERFKRASKRTATPVAVLIRQWAAERLEQWEREHPE